MHKYLLSYCYFWGALCTTTTRCITWGPYICLASKARSYSGHVHKHLLSYLHIWGAVRTTITKCITSGAYTWLTSKAWGYDGRVHNHLINSCYVWGAPRTSTTTSTTWNADLRFNGKAQGYQGHFRVTLLYFATFGDTNILPLPQWLREVHTFDPLARRKATTQVSTYYYDYVYYVMP